MKIVGAVSSDFSPSVAIKDPEIPKTATLMVNICEQYIDDWIRTRHLGPLGPLRECEHGHPRKKKLKWNIIDFLNDLYKFCSEE